MKYRFLSVFSALFLALQITAAHAEASADSAALIQVFVGVLELDNQTANWDDEPRGNVDIDFSSLPSGGLETEYTFAKGWVHWGLNPGGSVAWKTDDRAISSSLTDGNGGTLIAEADSSVFLAEIHLGAYIRGRLNNRITTYAAAGPMIMYGYHDVDNHNSTDAQPQLTPAGTVAFTETDSSDINVGYYLRAGLDFSIQKNQHIGVGVRYMSAELDFNKTVGSLDVKGPQYILTFSTQL